ncbi:HAMP domain-containing histidine kinase, partial [Alkaliphilus pronyensis]
MNFFKYLEEKRYFLILFIIMMLFITLMMIVSTNREQLVSNILYTNLGCTFLASIYIVIGYFYHNSFYKQLNELIKSDEKEILEAAPKPQNYEQELHMQLLKKVHSNYMDDIEKLHNEKKEHQDFIMSWIHEVKLPITASLMLMKNSSGKTVDFLVDKFEDELHKIENYVEQALYYSRIDSFSKDYFITEISLNQVIRKSIKKHSKLFINKRINFTIW